MRQKGAQMEPDMGKPEGRKFKVILQDIRSLRLVWAIEI